MRKCTAQHLANLVEKVGAVRLLSGVKDLTDRILPAVTKLTQDSSQEARYVETFFLFCGCMCYELGFLQVGPHSCLYTQIIFSVCTNDLLWDSLIFSGLPKCKERDSGWVCKLITDNPYCG